MRTLRALLLVAICLTLVVVVFGAYVRLSDAGLGCPDWPGCYGKATPTQASADIRQAEALQPGGPVSLPKAWKEMIHRYLAASLGLLIVVIAVISWKLRREAGSAPGVASALVGVVIFQGLLGKWTVTLLLKPAIVTAHLLGGLTTLALLVWLLLRARAAPAAGSRPGLIRAARIGMVLLVAQIALGGWTSTNYAALACPDFPTCHGEWLPDADFGNAFHVVRELGKTPEGDLLSLEALTAIHWSHRLGAVLAGSYLLLLGALLTRQREQRAIGAALCAAVAMQIVLGIANVYLSLPLPLAVAHNAGAAVLIVLLVTINYRPGRATSLAPRIRSGNENAYA